MFHVCKLRISCWIIYNSNQWSTCHSQWRIIVIGGINPCLGNKSQTDPSPDNCEDDFDRADTEIPEHNMHVLVNHYGMVIWVPHRIYRSSCSVDISMFPFDSQVSSFLINFQIKLTALKQGENWLLICAHCHDLCTVLTIESWWEKSWTLFHWANLVMKRKFTEKDHEQE